MHFIAVVVVATLLWAVGASAMGWWLLAALLEGSTTVLLWACAWGYGTLLERALQPFEAGREPAFSARFAARAGGGLALLMIACHLLGLAGGLHPVTVALIGAVGLGAALRATDPRSLAPRLREALRLPHPVLAVAAAPVVLLLLAATLPPGVLWQAEAAGYDALGYHLEVPREWFDAGRIVPLPHNTYGYLPLNLETLYFALMVARGGPLEAMFACQWLHASLALATALLLAVWTAERTGSRSAGGVAGALFVALPGTTIVGSLAYNDMALLFLGACTAVLIAANGRAGFLAGLLAGAAIGCKLTGVGFVAAPAAAGIALQSGLSARRLGLFAAGVLLALLPHLARNAAWTGNPAFPMAAVLGRAHWSEVSQERWERAHAPPGTVAQRLASVWSNGVLDERFHPAWWLAALAGLALALRAPGRRPDAAACAAVAGVQYLFWAGFTHTAGRFLLPVVAPLCVAVGLGWTELEARVASPRGRTAAWVGLCALLALLTWNQAARFRRDTELIPGLAAADYVRDPFLVRDARVPPKLSSERFLLLGEARALYFPAGTAYHTPFEEGGFARLWRERKGNPAGVLEGLRARGITLLHVNWLEVDRLRETYGLDPEISRENLRALTHAGAAVIREHSNDQVWLLRVSGG